MVSVVKNGLPVPAGQHQHPPLLEVADGAQPDVGLGHLLHGDRPLDPGGDAGALDAVTERQPVDHRGQHPHVVGVGAVHARCLRRDAAEDVPTADDDGDLGALAVDRDDLPGNPLHRLRVDAVSESGRRTTRRTA